MFSDLEIEFILRNETIENNRHYNNSVTKRNIKRSKDFLLKLCIEHTYTGREATEFKNIMGEGRKALPLTAFSLPPLPVFRS